MRNQFLFGVIAILVVSFASLILKGHAMQLEKPMHKEVFESTDRIEIIEATALTGAVNGEKEIYLIRVKYNLTSAESGTLMIGFNTQTPKSYVMDNELTQVISKGNGEYTFRPCVTVKDWGHEGDFFVYVNLSENPLPTKWSPFSDDKFTLISKREQALP